MKRNPFKSLPILFFLAALVFPASSQAQLVINEVSQGASGSKEYVELLVVGTPSCSGIPTVDLRGWYIDDNNGTFATGSGTGIANGCLRLTQDPLWAAVPIGQLIVIYNDADLNASIPAADLSLNDGNCHLIIPVSNCTLLEKHSTQPTIGNAVYPTSGFTACGNWGPVSMANSDDSFQTLNPSGTLVHSVSWGNNTTSTIIYFSGSSGGMVAFMNNSTSNNPNTQANWTRTAVAGNETPGQPNNAANALWIAAMNYNCSTYSPLSATASSTSTCACTGTATAAPSGGAGFYTYAWAPSGGNSATATGLCPGTYTCTVTDLAGCTQVVTATVNGNPAPVATLQSSTNVSCPGGSDGTATVSASGGSGTYTYSWAPAGGTGATGTGLSAGTYTCMITDSNGCSTTQQVTITEPQPLSVALSAPFFVCVNGSIPITGTITGNVGSVSWSGGTGSFSPSNAVNTTYFPGPGDAGSITLTVTVTNAGCSEIVTDAVTFNVGPLPNANITANGPISFCVGDSVTLTASGGTSYLWSTGATSTSIIAYTAGTYSVVATNNCGNDTAFVTVTTTNPPVASITANGPLTFCQNGSVTLTASGGSSYGWSNGDLTASTTITASGTYTVTASATCGTDTAAVIVDVLPLPQPNVTANGPLTFCVGDSVTLTASGGTSYVWSTTATSPSITVNTAGSYTVAVSTSCGTDTSVVIVNTTNLPVAQVVANGPTNICPGDSVTLTASGGSVFQWSTGATSSSIVVNAAGTYTVAVTGNCGTDTASISITNNPLPNAQITAGGPTTFCVGGNVVLTASGGNSYVWSTSATTASITVSSAGTYTVTASNGCGTDTAMITIATLPLPNAQITAGGPTTFCVGGNVTLTASGGNSYTWSNSSTSASITVNAAGTYTVTATNSCGSDQATITVNTIAPPVATLTANGPTSFCAGGNVLLTASGGSSYQWSTGASSASISVNTAGTFIVTVSNACGSDTASISTTVNPLPVASISGNTAICVNSSTTLTAGGGGNYLWSTGSTSGSISVSQGGTYYLIATNACGSDTASVTITTDQVTADFTADVYSGTAPVPVNFTDNSSSNANSWSWWFGDGGTSTATNPGYTYTAGGTYNVVLTVTDAFGCMDTAMATIIITDIPSVITIPNVFTPNGDGTNDYFIVHTEGLKEYSIEIYDRWGMRVYESGDPSAYWNGKSVNGSDATDGTYYYVIHATGFDKKEYNLAGFLTLIRDNGR